MGADDLGGEQGLGDIGRAEGGDGGDCGRVAHGAVVRRGGEARRQGSDEGIQGLAGDGGGELGESLGDVHELGRVVEGSRW